jgi:hypothetical protein
MLFIPLSADYGLADYAKSLDMCLKNGFRISKKFSFGDYNRQILCIFAIIIAK